MDGMEKLRRGISPEIADTGSHPIHCKSQILRRMGRLVPEILSVMPVLTEQAVKCAPVIENSQVFVTIFRASRIGISRESGTRAARTDPISHTIRGQRIIVPGKESHFWWRSDLFSLWILPHTAVACFSSSYLTLVEAVPAGYPILILRR
jgi:hypothetical protein